MAQSNHAGEAYIFGGTGVPFGATASNRLHRLRISPLGEVRVEEQTLHAESRQEGQDGGGDSHLLPKVYGQSMLMHCGGGGKEGDVIYIIGGTTGHVYNMDVWELRQRGRGSSHWGCRILTVSHLTTPLPAYHTLIPFQNPVYNPIPGRYRLESILLPAPQRNSIVTFGGGAPDFLASFESLECFDLTKEAPYQQKTSPDPEHGYPAPRKCHALVEFGDYCLIFGGCRDDVELDENGVPVRHETRMVDDVWRIDLGSWSWTRVGSCEDGQDSGGHTGGISMAQPAFFHASTITAV